MSYENFDAYAFDMDLLDLCTSEFSGEETFNIPPMAKGMRVLDYEPDTDDFEYMQSIVY